MRVDPRLRLALATEPFLHGRVGAEDRLDRATGAGVGIHGDEYHAHGAAAELSLEPQAAHDRPGPPRFGVVPSRSVPLLPGLGRVPHRLAGGGERRQLVRCRLRSSALVLHGLLGVEQAVSHEQVGEGPPVPRPSRAPRLVQELVQDGQVDAPGAVEESGQIGVVYGLDHAGQVGSARRASPAH